MMDVDIPENNNDFDQSQHAQHAPHESGLDLPQHGRTDVGSKGTGTHSHSQTPVGGEYDEDFRGRGRGHVTTAHPIASEGDSDKTVTSAAPHRIHIRGGEVGGGQRRLSIQDLLDNGNTDGGHGIGRPQLHSAHSSPGSAGTGGPYPWDRDSPFLPTPAAGSAWRATGIGGGDDSPSSQSRTHSPVPLPPPRTSLTKRPGPISLNSSPFPRSARQSARASPYPQITPVGLGTMGPPSSASPPGDHPHQPSPGLSPTTVGAAFTSPGGGSMSTNRRAMKPDWPSPKKKDVRSNSHSFGSARPHSSLLTPKEWYAQTPTVLRVPPSARLQSPAFPSSPVSIPGSARRPGPTPGGVPANSAPVPGTARRVHLSDVPKSKLINALNGKAAEYWFSPETSDCRIYVPVSKKRAGGSAGRGAESEMEGQDSSPDSAMGEGPRGALWPPTPDVPAHVDASQKDRMNVVNSHRKTSGGRRGSVPNEQDVPVLVFPLHRDYLIIQSNLLRTLLSTNSTIDMALRTSPTRPAFAAAGATSPLPGAGASSSTPQARSFPTPRPGSHMKERTLKGARVLPAKEGEPISVFLPLPDPASFGVILHWLYWGDVTSLEQALSRGLVTWQGIVKNIEYLSMDDSIKRVMGKWWRTWVKTDVGRARQQESDRERERGERGVSVSASSEGGNDDGHSDCGGDADDEGMQVDDNGREDGEEDRVSDLLKNL